LEPVSSVGLSRPEFLTGARGAAILLPAQSLSDGYPDKSTAMDIRARVVNRPGSHEASVSAGDRERRLGIPLKDSGSGSGVSGGELLFLALATCRRNDLYREAARRHIQIDDASAWLIEPA
jgi:hypothetical protein